MLNNNIYDIRYFTTQAMNMIGEKGNKDAAEKLAKEQELQKIHVKKEDVEVIVSKYRSWSIVQLLLADTTIFFCFMHLF